MSAVKNLIMSSYRYKHAFNGICLLTEQNCSNLEQSKY